MVLDPVAIADPQGLRNDIEAAFHDLVAIGGGAGA